MNLPTTPAACRIATLFNRRLTTAWNDREVKSIKALMKSHCFDSLDDLELIERYYVNERRKGEKGIQRRDLYTFLNNFVTELDRARLWNPRFRTRTGYTVKKENLNGEKPLTDEEFIEAGKLGKEIMARWKASQRQPSTS